MSFWTQAKLDALDAAYSQGASSVSYSDRTVRFHTVEEYLKLRAWALSEISAGGATDSSAGRSTYAVPSRD